MKLTLKHTTATAAGVFLGCAGPYAMAGSPLGTQLGSQLGSQLGTTLSNVLGNQLPAALGGALPLGLTGAAAVTGLGLIIGVQLVKRRNDKDK